MGIKEYLEDKSTLLIKIALTAHAILFLIFTVAFLLIKEEMEKYYKIYVTSISVLSLTFMIYFAHHSVLINIIK